MKDLDLATEQLRIFRHAASLLASSLEFEETLANTVQAFLPALGDYGFFDVVLDDGVRRTVRAHQDPETEALLRPTQWVRQERTDINLCALSSGAVALHSDVDDTWYCKVAANDGHLALLRQLGFRSMLSVPMRYGDDLIGSLTLFMGRSGRRHSYHDVAFSQELAALAAPVVVNVRLLERQRHAQAALRLSEERLRLATDAGNIGIWDWDVPTDRVNWSEQVYELHGLKPGQFGCSAGDFAELVHPDDRARVWQRIEQAMRDQDTFSADFRTILPDGRIRWLSTWAHVYRDKTGAACRMVGATIDITARKHTEQNLRFVAKASAELANLVDQRETLDKVVQLAIPSFADWCVVDLVDEHGDLRRVAVAHRDPFKAVLGHQLQGRFPPQASKSDGPWHAQRSGQPLLMERINEAALSETIDDPEYLAILRQLGLRSYIVAPLVVRGKTLGVITFVYAESRRSYSKDDLALAEEIARRAAVAIENASLYHSLREADRRKDDFLAMLAHELRNPLAPIRAAADLLKMPIGEDAIRRTSEVISRQVGHMTGLVDDLLDVSRVTRGLVALERKPVDLKLVAAAAMEQVRPLAEARAHRLISELAVQDLFVLGDEKRLVQVLANLLNNACRYTEEQGRIELLIRPEDEMVEISVADNGVGMAPSLVSNAFTLFVQGERPSDRGQGGLGLGLALVKSLVELQGGTVRAYSKGPGQGSRFTIYLPRLATPSQEGQAGQEEASPQRRALRILLVDDNADAAHMLALFLQAAGHYTEVCHEAPAALEWLHNASFDVCLLDIGLPGMDGNELARYIRQRDQAQAPRLIAISGYGQERDRQQALAAGFNHYLVKPVDAGQLLSLLDAKDYSPGVR